MRDRSEYLGDEAAIPRSPREWRQIWLATWLSLSVLFAWPMWLEVRWWGARTEPGAITKVFDAEGYTTSKRWEISPVGKLVVYQFGAWNQPVIGKQYVSRNDAFQVKQNIEIEYLGSGTAIESRIQGTSFTFWVWCFGFCGLSCLRQCLWLYTHPVPSGANPLEDRELFKQQKLAKQSKKKHKHFDIDPS